MELFKFIPTTGPTYLEQGQIINGYKRATWTERYADLGEFEIQAFLSSGLREFLPIGTLISHSDTLEVMIVENHEINQAIDEDPTLTITGRSFESILEQRMVGVNLARASTTFLLTDYTLTPANSWEHAKQMINQHIWDASTVLVDPDDELPNIVAESHVSGVPGSVVARTFDRGPVLDHVRNLLSVDDIGVKTVRRNEFGGTGSTSNTVIYIYTGVDKSATVHFSWKSGDLDSADYLFSNKSSKNTALVISKYLWWVVDLGPTKYDRRMMMVDAGFLDETFDTPPTLSETADLINAMDVVGRDALASQKTVNISRTDISSTTKYQFRKDYNIGDIVSIDGNFGTIQKMRVVEFVEIEDENGESGHPTLSLPGV